MRASMLSAFKEFLTADNVLPLVENVDSYATVDARTTKMSRVSRDKIGYLGTFKSLTLRCSSKCTKVLCVSIVGIGFNSLNFLRGKV
jgi:hypothetical protein